MLCLSARTYQKDEAGRDFTLLASYQRKLTYSGETVLESAYSSKNDCGEVIMHVYFHRRKGESRWEDGGLHEGEARFYDCDGDTFRSYIGLMAYCGEIDCETWRKLDRLSLEAENRDFEY